MTTRPGVSATLSPSWREWLTLWRRWRAGRAGALAVLSVSAIVSALALCACVPTRPNVLPFQLSVSDGEVQLRWCGREDVSAGFVRTYFRVVGEDAVTALEADGDILIAVGEPFGERVRDGRVDRLIC